MGPSIPPACTLLCRSLHPLAQIDQHPQVYDTLRRVIPQLCLFLVTSPLNRAITETALAERGAIGGSGVPMVVQPLVSAVVIPMKRKDVQTDVKARVLLLVAVIVVLAGLFSFAPSARRSPRSAVTFESSLPRAARDPAYRPAL